MNGEYGMYASRSRLVLILVIILSVFLLLQTKRTTAYIQPAKQQYHSNNVTVIIDSSIEKIGSGAKAAVYRGFLEWTSRNDNLPKVRFTEGCCFSYSEAPDGKNVVMYRPIISDEHKNDIAVAVTFWNPQGHLVETDIIINSAYLFTSEGAGFLCQSKYDLQNLITHEAGHFFGLGDIKNEKATMHFRQDLCETKKRTLSSLDLKMLNEMHK